MLPVKQAKSLADTMAKHGLSGSISMGKATPMEPEEDGSNDSEGTSELDHCIDDFAQAIMARDVAGIKAALKDLLETLKADDYSSDEE